MEETLTEMAIEAMNTKCVCKLCTRLRLILYHQTQERLRAQSIMLNTLQEQNRSETVSKGLEYIDALTHAKPSTNESQSGV